VVVVAALAGGDDANLPGEAEAVERALRAALGEPEDVAPRERAVDSAGG
jgi:hypothetical protein